MSMTPSASGQGTNPPETFLFHGAEYVPQHRAFVRSCLVELTYRRNLLEHPSRGPTHGPRGYEEQGGDNQDIGTTTESTLGLITIPCVPL